MADDYRTRLTKKMLGDCLRELLENTSLNKITVSDLCRRAHVNRSTFYRHYSNTMELFEDLERQFLESIEQLDIFKLKANATKEAYIQALVPLLNEYKRNRSLLLAMQSGIGKAKLDDRHLQRTYDFMASGLGRIYHGLSTTHDKLLFAYNGYGSSAVIFAWLEGDMEESVETIASFLGNCTFIVSKSILDMSQKGKL